MKVSRRTFSGALLSASALPAAQDTAGAAIDLPEWRSPAAGGEPFVLSSAPSPRTRWNVPGPPRKYYAEWLPALFERTVEIGEWTGEAPRFQWIFTGPEGGFTVEAGGGKARLSVRYYDSPGLAKVPPVAGRPARHPEGLWEASAVEYRGELKAVSVALDHQLTLTVRLNGKDALSARAVPDVNQHQMAFAGAGGAVRGRLLEPVVQTSQVDVEEAVRFQEMLGWGGTTTPPAFAELSPEGVRRWWQMLVEYNLLLHREYPTGVMLNPEMNNWDRPADASPHYYGDNFPNCETSDFAYMRTVRRLGGQVIFEFWDLPAWAKRRDAAGRLTEAPDVAAYGKAMVRYCQVAREKTGRAPEIVGIQNEITQSAEDWQRMTLELRRGLDAAGFQGTRIHMHNASYGRLGIAAGRAFRADPAVWKAIDYAASNLYDFQDHFHDPDGFDGVLSQLREATAGKPFFAVELCVNNTEYQSRAYRVALAMGQLYHKVLTGLDAVGAMYCWTLLNVVEPSYGWTRTLFVPDREHGFVPAASSYQLRIFGAYSRRIRAGMHRVQATSSQPHLLATAFSGSGGKTVVLLNRSTAAQAVRVNWPGAAFRYRETASPYEENSVEAAPRPSGGGVEVTVAPGAIVTLTSVELGKLNEPALER